MFTGGAEPALTAARHHRQVQGEQQTNRLVPPSSQFEDGLGLGLGLGAVLEESV